MTGVTKIILYIICTTILLSSFGLSTFSSADEYGDATYQMRDVDDVVENGVGLITESDASDFRTEIDDSYGDSDGNVTQDELDAYKDELDDYLEGKQKDAIYIENKQGKIRDFSGTFDNALGDVDSTDTITMTWQETIIWEEIDSSLAQLVFAVSDMSSKDNFTFNSIEGWEIIKVVGLSSQTISSDKQEVTGSGIDDTTVEITIKKEEESSDSFIPGFELILFVSSIGVSFLIRRK